jgi:hypothetical protein
MDITFGLFLHEYASKILRKFNGILSGRRINGNVGSFPMKLSAVTGKDSVIVFNTANKNVKMSTILPKEGLIFLLETIPPDEMHEFNQNYNYKEESHIHPNAEAESNPECMVCFGGLDDQVFESDPNHPDSSIIELPIIESSDMENRNITTFPCGHKIHTHCFLKSCSHKYYKCLRCTVDPSDSWLLSEFTKIVPAIENCYFKSGRELEIFSRNIRYDSFNIEDTYPRDIEMYGEPEATRKREIGRDRMKALKDKENELKFIHLILNNEHFFLYDRTITPGSFFRSHFQQNTTPNLNGFQQLNLLLDRVI